MVANCDSVKFLGLFVLLVMSFSLFGFSQADIDSSNSLGVESRFILSQLVDCVNNTCNDEGYVNEIFLDDEGSSSVAVSYSFDESGEVSEINLDGNSNFFTQLSIRLRPDLNIDSYTRTFLGFIPGGETRSFDYSFYDDGVIKSSSVNHGSRSEDRVYDVNGVITEETFVDENSEGERVNSYVNGVLSKSVNTGVGSDGVEFVIESSYVNGVLNGKVSTIGGVTESATYDFEGNRVSTVVGNDESGYEIFYSDGVPTSIVSRDPSGVYRFELNSDGVRVSGTFQPAGGSVEVLSSEELAEINAQEEPVVVREDFREE